MKLRDRLVFCWLGYGSWGEGGRERTEGGMEGQEIKQKEA